MAMLSDTKRRGLIPWFVAMVAVGATLTTALSSPRAIADDPFLFVLLLGLVVLLDLAEIDLFGRGRSTPSGIPLLAIAAFFGVFGTAVAAAMVCSMDIVKRKSPIKVAFDFSSLTLSGVAAVAIFTIVPAEVAIARVAEVSVAGLAYALVNWVLICCVWYLDEGIAPSAAFRERIAWKWPYDAACGLLAGMLVVAELEIGPLALALLGAPIVLLWWGEKNQTDRSREIVEELRYINHELEGANRRLREALADNQLLLATTHRTYLSTITSLARTIEAKDPYTGGHTERVADIALALAIELGFEDEDLRAVQVGAIIHDIGKIGIPDAILLKPGKLNDEEFAEMRRHPEISSYILDELELPPIVKDMARHHHERFDGRGYPDRLPGEQIPLAARILTVADAFDAMTSDRPYRRALPEDVARGEIEKGSGSQFCPVVADALLRVLDRGLPGAIDPAKLIADARAALSS